MRDIPAAGAQPPAANCPFFPAALIPCGGLAGNRPHRRAERAFTGSAAMNDRPAEFTAADLVMLRHGNYRDGATSEAEP
jgi:hypothetical protein